MQCGNNVKEFEGFMMKKQYVIGALVIFALLLIATVSLTGSDEKVINGLVRLLGGATVYFVIAYIVILISPLRKTVSVVSVLAFAIALSLLINFVNKKDSPNRLEELLPRIVSDINASSPKIISDGLQLDGAEKIDKTLRYNYKFLNAPASKISGDQVQQSVIEELRKEVCTNMQLILKQNAYVEYVFHGNDGLEITKLNYSRKSCMR